MQLGLQNRGENQRIATRGPLKPDNMLNLNLSK